MPAEIHFATFGAALMEALEYGLRPHASRGLLRVRSELDQAQSLVEVYLRRLFNTLAEHSVNFRQLLLSNKHEHRPARRHESACGTGRRAVQEAHLRCASPLNRELHGHPHPKQIEGTGGGGRLV